MAFEIDGETWQPQTAVEHADQIIDEINRLLQENNIQDASGNVIQLNKNFSNALYLLTLGDGQRFADNDAKLSKAINSFNIELCDDAQIENLLPIAAITRNPGSYSTLQIVVTASADGQCVVPAGARLPYEDVNFVVPTETVISAGSSAVIETVCDTLGPVVVLTGEVTAFENEIANMESVINPTSSVPGIAPETTNALRRRLINADTIKYSLDGCKRALEELTGINHARIYFNYNVGEPLELAGGVEVDPRTAYIVVLGSSDKIAETYAEYMSAPTQNDPNAEGTYSTVNITITAGAGDAVLPAETSATYDGHTFVINAGTTVEAGSSAAVPFTCTEWGPYAVPVLGIEELDQEIANVESAQNLTPAIPGTGDPKHSQNWVTSSGQEIPIKYDDAKKQNIYVKVFLEVDAEAGTQVDNQIKKDLIYASANWEIGDVVTQLLTSAPFVDCKYTKVAYTKVSADGITWDDVLTMGCNTIPAVTDGTISIEQLEE